MFPLCLRGLVNATDFVLEDVLIRLINHHMMLT